MKSLSWAIVFIGLGCLIIVGVVLRNTLEIKNLKELQEANHAFMVRIIEQKEPSDSGMFIHR